MAKITLIIILILISGCTQKTDQVAPTPKPVNLPMGAVIILRHGATWYEIEVGGKCFLLRDYGNVSYKSKMKCNN